MTLLRMAFVGSILVTLAGCSGGSLAPELSSVPQTMPSLDNDRAQMEGDIQESRVAALRNRMAAMKDEDAGEGEPSTIDDRLERGPTLAVPVQPDVKVSASVDNPAPKVKEVLSDTSSRAGAALSGFREFGAAEPVAHEGEAAMTPKTTPATESVAAAPRFSAPAKAPVAAVATSSVQRAYTYYLGSLDFANNQRQLTQSQLAELSSFVGSLLKKNAKGTFIVQGFASQDKDPTPASELVNLKLSLKRAEVVRDALVYMGVDRAQMRLEAYGTANPYNFAQPNRRVLVWFKQ